MSNESISIILPIYNQADHVWRVVESYITALYDLPRPYEIILVVNGCRDDSLAACQSIERAYPDQIRVLHSVQGGWGLAVNMGLRAAQGSILCYTNSARTTPEDLALLILYALVNKHVVVKANRKIRESWQRRLGSLLYNLECRTLFDLSYWDINGTPKVFPRAFTPLLHLTSQDDLIDAEFNLICRREGYRMIEVPIFSTRRFGGQSTTNYRSALKMYLGVYKMWQHMRYVR